MSKYNDRKKNEAYNIKGINLPNEELQKLIDQLVKSFADKNYDSYYTTSVDTNPFLVTHFPEPVIRSSGNTYTYTNNITLTRGTTD